MIISLGIVDNLALGTRLLTIQVIKYIIVFNVLNHSVCVVRLLIVILGIIRKYGTGWKLTEQQWSSIKKLVLLAVLGHSLVRQDENTHQLLKHMIMKEEIHQILISYQYWLVTENEMCA